MTCSTNTNTKLSFVITSASSDITSHFSRPLLKHLSLYLCLNYSILQPEPLDPYHNEEWFHGILNRDQSKNKLESIGQVVMVLAFVFGHIA